MNPYSINPSFAGSDGKPSVFLTYRQQWAGIEGAPTISNFSFHTPVGNKLGFGLNVNNAQRSILNTTSAYMTFSYNLAFSKDVQLRFGLSGGAAYNGVDFAEIENIGDPELQGLLLENNTYVLANAGLSLQLKTLNLGVSIPNLFTDEYTTIEDFTTGEVEPLENVILFLSNRFYFGNDKHVFEPFVLYRYSDLLPHQIEASAAVHLNHVVWFGGSYKQDFGISAFGGIKLKKSFGIGYAYSLKNTGLNEISSPTHEIQLNLLLGNRKEERNYYSFVDTSKPKKKSKRQLALEKKREEEAQKLEEEKQREAEEAAIAEAEETERLEAEKIEQERIRKEREAEAAQGEDQLDEVEENDTEYVDLGADDPVDSVEDEEYEEPKTKVAVDKPGNLIEEQSTDERVVVKRGNHLLELEPGEYVVVGVFSSYENAEKYSDELFFKGHKTRFGYLSGKGLWYVYAHKGDDLDKARSERDSYRKTRTFSKAWVITVE